MTCEAIVYGAKSFLANRLMTNKEDGGHAHMEYVVK